MIFSCVAYILVHLCSKCRMWARSQIDEHTFQWSRSFASGTRITPHQTPDLLFTPICLFVYLFVIYSGMHFSQAVAIIQSQVGVIKGVQVLYSETVRLCTNQLNVNGKSQDVCVVFPTKLIDCVVHYFFVCRIRWELILW